MQCEVCGCEIQGRPFKAIIEGARLVVCSDCATLGSFSWELKTPRIVKSPVKPRKPLKSKLKAPKRRESPLDASTELVADFGVRIRQAREAQELSHEDLGRRINEKISVLKKLESSKMKPDNKLAEKLQHALKIKLLIPPKDEKLPKKLLTVPSSKTITFGDLIKTKKKLEETK